MALLALTLAGCGGGGGPDPFPSHFNTEVVWQADIPAAGQSTCFDFDAGSEVPTCLGNAWDLKITGRQDDALKDVTHLRLYYPFWDEPQGR